MSERQQLALIKQLEKSGGSSSTSSGKLFYDSQKGRLIEKQILQFLRNINGTDIVKKLGYPRFAILKGFSATPSSVNLPS